MRHRLAIVTAVMATGAGLAAGIPTITERPQVPLPDLDAPIGAGDVRVAPPAKQPPEVNAAAFKNAEAVAASDPVLATLPTYESLREGPWTSGAELLGVALHVRLKTPVSGQVDLPGIDSQGVLDPATGAVTTSQGLSPETPAAAVYRDPARRVILRYNATALRDLLVMVSLDEQRVVRISPGPESVAVALAVKTGRAPQWESLPNPPAPQAGEVAR